VAQDLRQVGRADLAGSARAVGEGGELDVRFLGHGSLQRRLVAFLACV
jgi:hypothetical protein